MSLNDGRYDAFENVKMIRVRGALTQGAGPVFQRGPVPPAEARDAPFFPVNVLRVRSDFARDV